MPDDRLSLSLQEDLLVLACFNAQTLPIIRNALGIELFGNAVYRDILSRVYEYFDRYKEPPAEHTPDLLEDRLGKGDRDSQMYVDLLTLIHDHRNRVNVKYTIDRMEGFIRTQALKIGIISASEALQEGKLDEAESILIASNKQRVSVFNPGSTLADGLKKAFSHDIRQNILPLGIKELDRWDLGPARGELLLYIAGPKSGKSWFLIHLAKRGLLHQQRVLYITLELSEAQIEQRILQSLFSVTRRKQKVDVTRLRMDELGRLLRFEPEAITPRASFDDLTKQVYLEKRLQRLHPSENLLVRQFPAGQLTVRQLTAFMDMLEQAHAFVPDILLIDYPKYMKLSSDNYRIEVGALMNDIRGLAVERNIAIATVKESNRAGVKSKMITGGDAGEDYSAIYTADTIFTYTQTVQERQLGLARLFVDSTRVAERDKFVLLLSQAYSVGQYCLDSAALSESYWGHLETAVQNMPVEPDEEEE